MIWFKLWRDTRKHAFGGLGLVLLAGIFHSVVAPFALSIFGVDPAKLPHFPLVLAALPQAHSAEFASRAWWLLYLNMAVFMGPLLGILTAGSGISSQGVDGLWRGMHPSVIYTLSLPVTRRRWMTARAGLGLLEMAVLVLLLAAMPAALAPVTGGAFSWKSGLVSFLFLMLGSGVFFALSTFFATFLDEHWQTVSAAAVLLTLAMTAAAGRMAGWSVFEFMSGLYPSISGAMACIALMVLFFIGALWIVERREY